MSPQAQAETSASTVDAVPATAVSDQLARIVNSPRFISSPRLCRFLTHIVNRTIHGDLDSLKEFSIAVEVFDRNSEYDPNIDAIVRVEARRLRTKLKEYYEGPGRNDGVLIGGPEVTFPSFVGCSRKLKDIHYLVLGLIFSMK
jgi:adenylate cyclase